MTTTGSATVTLYVDTDQRGSGHRTVGHGTRAVEVGGCWTAIIAEGASVKHHRFPTVASREQAEFAVRGVLGAPRRRIDWVPSGNPVSAWRAVVPTRVARSQPHE